MTTLPLACAETATAYLAEAAVRLTELCTGCGACFAACPMARQIGLAETDLHAVGADLKRLARGEAAALPDTTAWVGACAKSGLCVSACPEQNRGLDAMLLVRIAKRQALNTTGQLQSKQDPAMFPRVKTFARLQLTDEELAKWL